MNSLQTVSIIVPSFGREDIIYTTLEKLVPVAGRMEAELILVDQTGYDKDKIKMITGPCKFRYLFLRPPGLPAARNAGAKAASGDILVFIDDDAEPQDRWLENHLKHYHNEIVGCVAGSVIDANAKGEAETPVTYSDKTGRYYTDFLCPKAQETLSVPGCNFSVRKKLWQKIRFDRCYKASALFEEVDFAFRLRKAGWVIQYEPDTRIIHNILDNGGCRFIGLRKIYYRFRNHALFYFRFSGKCLGVYFYIEEKKFAEYISRKPEGGHRIKDVFIAIVGSFIGTLIGLRKRWLRF